MKKKNNLDKAFGSYIREIRIKQDIGQRELAKKIGIAASYLNDIEKGKRTAQMKRLRGTGHIDDASALLEDFIDI